MDNPSPAYSPDRTGPDVSWMRPGMVLVDVETTGLDAGRHSVIDFALLAWTGASIVRSFRPLPGAQIDQAALEVNGQTIRTLDDRPLGFFRAIEDLFAFLIPLEREAEKLTLAGMNVHFDASMLAAAWELAFRKMRLPWTHRYYDLHSVATQYLGLIGQDGGKLYSETICVALGIEPEPKPHLAWHGVLWECAAFARINRNLRAMRASIEENKDA